MHASQGPASPVPAVSPRSWLRFLACCFAVICGFRWFLIERFGAPVVWGDDIDGIAYRILAPLHNGTLTWSALFAAHNGDHVIAATRAWDILWYYLNGEWDPKLVMMTKTPFYAAAMTIFIHLFTAGLPRARFLAAGVLTLLIAFPFNYHNLLWAFQSQFDFFFLTAALGWLALLNNRPVLALVCAAVSPFTLGAGPIVAISFVPFFAFAWLSRSWTLRKAATCTVVAGVIAVFGASLRTPDAMPHTGTLADKFAVLCKLAAWPFSNLLSAVERLPESANLIPGPLLKFPSAEGSWLLQFAAQLDRHPILVVLINLVTGALILAPLGIATWLVLRKRIALGAALGVFGVSVFAGLMIGATAVARTEQSTIAMRFLDHVMLAGFASIVAAFLLVAHDRRWRPWLAAWGLVLAFGYLATAGATMSQIVNRRKAQVGLEVMQRYYAGVEENGIRRNNHAAMLENRNFELFILSPDPTAFMAQLDDPRMRPIMPRAITEPGAPRAWAAAAAGVVGRWSLALVFAAVCAATWMAYRARQPRRAAVPVVVPRTAV